MNRKPALFCTALLLAVTLGACSTGENASSSDSSPAAESSSAATEEPAVTEPPAPCQIGYVTGHGEMDDAEISKFVAQTAQDGYEWEEVSLLEIPEETDLLIINSPTADLSADELNALDAYADQGRHVLLLLPANEAETRYKNLGHFLDGFCLTIDYDHITETDSTRMLNDNDAFILADVISYPSNMTLYSEEAASGLPFLLDARSFHFVYRENFDTIKIDAMLQTAPTAIGTPCGGTEDDPLTFEEERLTVMAYSRDEGRKNACVVAVGASNFLTDAHYDASYSRSPVDFVHSTLGWFRFYAE